MILKKTLYRATIRDNKEYTKEELEILKLELQFFQKILALEKERIINVDQDTDQVKKELQKTMQTILR